MKNTDKYFTGQITYVYSYKSDKLRIDSLVQLKPSTASFKFDLNNYQSEFAGKDTVTYSYSGKLNKALSETNNQGNFECEDYSISTDSVFNSRIYDTDEKVLGYACRVLEFKTRLFLTRYYISKDLRISPATYQLHKAYNWSFYGEKTGGGLILKLEHQFKNYTMQGTASAIIRAGKSYNALDIPESGFTELCKENK